MPIHDWTRVSAGIFHDFHQVWCVRIRERLNAGVFLRPGVHVPLPLEETYTSAFDSVPLRWRKVIEAD